MTGLLYIAQPLEAADAAASLLLAGNAAGAGVAVGLGWGGWPLPPAVAPGVDLLPLPPAIIEPTGRWPREPGGELVDPSWKKRRAAATLALSARRRPALLLLDGPAAVTGAFRFELLPLMEIAARRSPRPHLVAWMPRDGEWPADHPLPDRVVTSTCPAAVAAELSRLLATEPH